MYANLVYARGIENFYERCANAGIDSVLIADVPTNESGEFVAAAKKSVFTLIHCSANSEWWNAQVCFRTRWWLHLPTSSCWRNRRRNQQTCQWPHRFFDRLNKFDAPPAPLGFGISTEQVKEAIQAGAAGAISGSAVVKIIENNNVEPEEMLKTLAEFVAPMKAATQK